LLSHCLIAICFMSFAVCHVLINCIMFFNYSFYVCFLVLYVLLSISCVLCFCTVSCIVSPHVYRCLFSICVQYYRQLSPGGNPTAVNKYIISYNTHSYIRAHTQTRTYTQQHELLRAHIHTHADERTLGKKLAAKYSGWHSQMNACVTSEREYT